MSPISTFSLLKTYITRRIIDPAILKKIANTGDLSKYNIKFGYIPDYQDKTKFCFSKSVVAYTAPANEISLKDYFKEVSNQYGLGACVANATADTLEAQLAHKNNVSPTEIPDLSRLFIYWNSRNNMSPPSANKDDGTYVWLAMDSATRYGVPEEKYWPYDSGKVNVRPSVISYTQAIRHRFTNYYSINSTGDARLKDVIAALSAGCPVIFGTAVGQEIFSVKNSEPLGPPLVKIGKHAMVITGWSSSSGLFEVRNSWGTDFGVKGYFWITPEYLLDDRTQDLWAATV